MVPIPDFEGAAPGSYRVRSLLLQDPDVASELLPKPQKYVKNSPKPIMIAIKAVILHTFGVQV